MEHCPTGVRWARAAVILTDLTDRDEYVTLPGLEPRLDEGLADAIDAINRRYGSMHAGVGHAGIRGQGVFVQWNCGRLSIVFQSS